MSPELRSAMIANHREQHRKRNEGVDCSVLWLTHSSLRRLGLSIGRVKHAQRTGALKTARPGRGGLPALFHPEDVAEFLVARKEAPALASLISFFGEEKAKELHAKLRKISVAIATNIIKRTCK